MSDWKPEVGQECEFTCGVKWHRCEFVGERLSGAVVLFNEAGNYKTYHPHQVSFRPIKTQADKYRDEQIDALTYSIVDSEHASAEVVAERLYDKNVRILADNEFIGRELTDEQIEDLAKNHPSPLCGDRLYLISLVQKAIKGGE